jgi:hypothetical protein
MGLRNLPYEERDNIIYVIPQYTKWSEKMVIKIFWERSPAFVVEEEDAFFIEATADEAKNLLFPILCPQEKIKFEEMKDIYVAKSSEGLAREGCYYFLISRGAHTVKFESVSFMASDLASRGGKIKILPNLPISKIEDIDEIDVTKY